MCRHNGWGVRPKRMTRPFPRVSRENVTPAAN